jgi:hypothetical protein
MRATALPHASFVQVSNIDALVRDVRTACTGKTVTVSVIGIGSETQQIRAIVRRGLWETVEDNMNESSGADGRIERAVALLLNKLLINGSGLVDSVAIDWGSITPRFSSPHRLPLVWPGEVSASSSRSTSLE